MDLLSEIISFFIGAVAGSLLTIKVKSMRASGHGRNVDQSKASAGGDIVGGNKKN